MTKQFNNNASAKVVLLVSPVSIMFPAVSVPSLIYWTKGSDPHTITYDATPTFHCPFGRFQTFNLVKPNTTTNSLPDYTIPAITTFVIKEVLTSLSSLFLHSSCQWRRSDRNCSETSRTIHPGFKLLLEETMILFSMMRYDSLSNSSHVFSLRHTQSSSDG